VQNRHMSLHPFIARGAALAFLGLLAGCGGSDAPSGPSGGGGNDGTCAMTETQVPNEGWSHVAEGSATTYAHNPPASGPHYPLWLRYEAFGGTQARGYWVHNLEHGAVVLLYRPDASADLRNTMLSTYNSLGNDPACGSVRALLTPDPLLPTGVNAAVVAANFTLTGACVNPDRVRQFNVAHRGQAPEQICAGGNRP
jgi:hypothetical protein